MKGRGVIFIFVVERVEVRILHQAGAGGATTPGFVFSLVAPTGELEPAYCTGVGDVVFQHSNNTVALGKWYWARLLVSSGSGS